MQTWRASFLSSPSTLFAGMERDSDGSFPYRQYSEWRRDCKVLVLSFVLATSCLFTNNHRLVFTLMPQRQHYPNRASSLPRLLPIIIQFTYILLRSYLLTPRLAHAHYYTLTRTTALIRRFFQVAIASYIIFDSPIALRNIKSTDVFPHIFPRHNGAPNAERPAIR